MPVELRQAARICTVQIGMAATALFLLSTAAPTVAQTLPPENQRTVEWYRTHPNERAQVRRLCLNDPGHLANSPDCINAKRGDLAAAVRSPRQGSTEGDMSSPETPQYWTSRPNDRATTLAYCNRLTGDAAVRFYCGPARQSLQAEQRGSNR